MQPQLVLIANHALANTSRQGVILPEMNISPQDKEYYCLRYMQLTDKNVQTKATDLWPQGEKEIPCVFSYLDVHVNVQKHIIQFRFPFIYRAFFDFTPLRQAIFTLLKPIFTAYGTTECAVHPSFWEYSWLQYNNQWKLQRLEQMQQKILFQCVSYKRTILNLTHCLGEPCHSWQMVSQSKYNRWWQGSAYLENLE